MEMERVNRILRQDLYLDYLKRNELAEKDRKFCRHDMVHFLDVARIAMILNQMEDYGIEPEMIYAAALLHDIGRWKQYLDGTPHEKASAFLSPEILFKSGFDEEETNVIVAAIESNRDQGIREERSLKGLLYRADKDSRPCFACEAEKECNWKNERKNLLLKV